MPDENSPVVYGTYQLLELLARGGMAEVFKAKSHGVEGFEKILVIKRILPELSENPAFVEMFINEAKIAVSLSHANIVQVFDLGRSDHTYFIAMEYVAGSDLATVCSRGRAAGRRMPSEQAVYVVSELAKALDYAHRRRDSQMRPLGIVHRDVSPQNVLVSLEGEVKLTDFGIAKAALAVKEQTQAGVLKGKYAYMSPEQARAADVDSRSDLFSLGVLLYELLSGSNPFDGGVNDYDTLSRVRDGVHRPLLEVEPRVAPELAQIVARAMSVRPGDRYQKASDFYEELVQFLYTSGRRVGAHDLADHLLQLGDGQQPLPEVSGELRLREVFDQEEAGSEEYSPEATPVEVPRNRPAPSHQTTARRKTGVAHPTQERRDVSALVVICPESSPVDGGLLTKMSTRFGGLAVEQSCIMVSGQRQRTWTLLFGLKDPDGRDTEAAARCALQWMRASGAGSGEVRARIGIGQGTLLVDMSGRPIAADDAQNTLTSEGVSLAERAAAGQILISAAGHRAIAGLFVTSRTTGDDAAPFSVEGERSLADSSGKFVGRRAELRKVGELLAVANRGRMKVIGLVGEAGVGKTRLLLETRRRLELGGHDVGMHVQTCPRQSRRVPFSGIQGMLRAIVGLDEFAAEEEIREKVGRLRELGLAVNELAAVGISLGLPPDDEQLSAANASQLLRPAVGRIAAKLAEDRLTVLVWDSAENLDDESQALLDGLIRDARDSRVAVVLAYRPGFMHAWADMTAYFELTLGTMSDEDAAKLTAIRLAAEEVPQELLREVSLKSAGNPLYVEEYLKALADAGAIRVQGGRVLYDPRVAEVEVPKTLRGIVSSRLSKLSPTDRYLLQIAAIVGERFTLDVLAKVAGDSVDSAQEALEALEGRGLVQRGAGDYDFSHELIGEVLRDGLTMESRRQLHGAVAEALESAYPGRGDELAERLAVHYRRSGDRLQAIDYMVRAAARLESEHALTGAVAALEDAIELLSQLAMPDRDRMIELYGRIGELCFRSRGLAHGAEKMGEAVELCEALGRDRDIARFSMLGGRLLVNSPGTLEEGRRWLDRADGIARSLNDTCLLRDVILAAAEADMRIGEHSMASERFRDALRLAEEDQDLQAQVRSLILLAFATSSDGNVTEALEVIERARRLSNDGVDRFTECELLKVEGLVHFFVGDHAGTIEAGQKALEMAKEYGFTYEAAVNAHNVGEAYLRLGDYRRAFASLRYSHELCKDHGYLSLQWANMRVLGFIDATRFGSKEGRRHVIEASDYARDNGLIWGVIQSLYYLAIIDQQRGHNEIARDELREVLRLAAEHGHGDYVIAAERAVRALDAGEPIELPGHDRI